MESALSWGLAGLCVLSAVGVVGFESTKRSTTCLLLTGAFGAALLLAQGAGEVGAGMFWLIGTASMLLLLTALLLNLRDEDIGRRRMSVRRTVACFIMAYVGAAIAGMLFGDPAPIAAATTPPSTMGLAESLFETGSVSMVLIALSLLAVVPAALLLARRQA